MLTKNGNVGPVYGNVGPVYWGAADASGNFGPLRTAMEIKHDCRSWPALH